MRERIFGWVKTHRVLSILIGVVVLVALIGGLGSIGHKASDTTVANQPPAATAPATTAPATQTSTPPPTPNPQGTDMGSCNVQLAGSINGDDYLTGEVDVDNTGNIGIVVKVTISWPQEGFSPITESKTVTVPYGNSDYPVEFSYDAGSIAGSGTPAITNFQNWQEGHNYPSNDCTYSADIINTSGTVQ